MMLYFLPPSSKYLPPTRLMSPPWSRFLRMMLITPAIASVPYCAAAPSCSTSIRSIASCGIRLRSGAALPPNTVPATTTLGLLWRRLPSISTSVWLGLRPRSLIAGWKAAWSLPNACTCAEGRICASACTTSVWPTVFSTSAPSTCTGAGLSEALKPCVRVPVTTISSGPVWSAAASGAASGAMAVGAAPVPAAAASAANAGAAESPAITSAA